MTRRNAALLALCALAAPACWIASRAAAAPSALPRITMEQDESYLILCNYTPLYGASGPTVSSATCDAERVDGKRDAVPSEIIAGAIGTSGQVVSLRITPANRRGTTYRVHCLATMSNTDKSACNFVVEVRDAR